MSAGTEHMEAATCTIRPSLDNMPNEILCHITRHLEASLRDLAALYIAAPGLFEYLDVTERATAWGAEHIYRLIKADPPFAVYHRALSLRQKPLFRRLLKAAASRGRLDILADLVPRLKSHGWVDVMRFLTTRPIWHVTWTRALKQTDSPTASAARHGQLEALQFVHDRRVRKRARRNCASETVRSAMWESDNADVPRWLEWYGCEAYRPPRACDLISMIEQGRARMLAYAISKAPLAISEMRSAATEAAVRSAARAGHMETLRVVLGAGLCNRLSPVLAGAAAGCRTRIMEWVTTPPSDDPCLVGIEPVTVADARAAAVYAMTESTDPCSSIAFFIRRFGTDVADAGMLHVAVARSAIGCARLIESRAFEGDDDARRSFQWASLVPGALTVGSVDALRFLVEEKGARVEPHHIAACCPLSLDATAYLGARYSPSLFQVAIDIMGARIRLGTREAVRQLFERVPGLCASVADAVLSANGAPREPLCDCAKCTQHSTL